MFGVCFSEAVRAGLRPSLDESGELSAMPPLSESHSVLLPCVPMGWMLTVLPLVPVLAITLVESQPGSLLLWSCGYADTCCGWFSSGLLDFNA